MRNENDYEGELNQLIQDFHFKKLDTPTGRPTSRLLETLVSNSKDLY